VVLLQGVCRREGGDAGHSLHHRLGLHELHLNVQRVGNQVLAPRPIDYTHVVGYNAFDMMALL
jgi:hypothetical protein